MKKLIVIDCNGIDRDSIDKMQNKLCTIEYSPMTQMSRAESSYSH